jgi:hypothetical protein
MPFDQGEFNFDAQGDYTGWRRWREKLDARKRAFETRWGVVLGKRVTLWLKDHAKPVVGIIEIIEPPANQRHLPPTFRIRGLEFGPDEIESLTREEA